MEKTFRLSLIILMIVVVKYALAQDYINTAITYYNRGNDHYTKAEYDPAMSDLNEAIRLAPNLAVDISCAAMFTRRWGAPIRRSTITRRRSVFPDLAPLTLPTLMSGAAAPTTRRPSTTWRCLITTRPSDWRRALLPPMPIAAVSTTPWVATIRQSPITRRRSVFPDLAPPTLPKFMPGAAMSITRRAATTQRLVAYELSVCVR